MAGQREHLGGGEGMCLGRSFSEMGHQPDSKRGKVTKLTQGPPHPSLSVCFKGKMKGTRTRKPGNGETPWERDSEPGDSEPGPRDQVGFQQGQRQGNPDSSASSLGLGQQGPASLATIHITKKKKKKGDI